MQRFDSNGSCEFSNALSSYPGCSKIKIYIYILLFPHEGCANPQGGCLWLMEHATSAGLVFSRMSKNEAVWWLLRAPTLGTHFKLTKWRTTESSAVFIVWHNCQLFGNQRWLGDSLKTCHFSGENPRTTSFSSHVWCQRMIRRIDPGNNLMESCRIKVMAFLNNLIDGYNYNPYNPIEIRYQCHDILIRFLQMVIINRVISIYWWLISDRISW